MDGELLSATFVELTDTMVVGFDVIDFLHVLTGRSVQLLDVSAAGLLLADPRGELRVVAASSEAARLREQVIGALNLFRTDPGALAPADIRVGQALADVATISLLHERSMRHSDTLNEQLQTALNSRVVIEQAKGKLAERLGVDMDQAFSLLRDRARTSNRRLSDLAQRSSTAQKPSPARPRAGPGSGCLTPGRCLPTDSRRGSRRWAPRPGSSALLATGELWLFLLQFPLANLCRCVLFARTASSPNRALAETSSVQLMPHAGTHEALHRVGRVVVHRGRRIGQGPRVARAVAAAGGRSRCPDEASARCRTARTPAGRAEGGTGSRSAYGPVARAGRSAPTAP